jgi:hypothetical protein
MLRCLPRFFVGPLSALGLACTLACSSAADRPPAVKAPQLRSAPVLDPSGCVWQPPVVLAAVKPADLSEISGMAVSQRHQDHLWVHNDSGADPQLALLQADGQLRARLTLKDAPHTDWEALALGPCPPQLQIPGELSACLWIGDIGDNDALRDHVHLIAVREPSLLPPLGSPDLTVAAKKGDWRSVEVQYPGGPRNAEALALLPGGAALLFTKREDGRTEVFRAEALQAMAEKDDKIHALALGTLSLAAAGVQAGAALRVTAADFEPQSQRLAVRTYGSVQLFADALQLAAAPTLTAAQLPQWQGLLLPSPPEPQGEALAWRGPQRWISISEGKFPKIYQSECLSVAP